MQGRRYTKKQFKKELISIMAANHIEKRIGQEWPLKLVSAARVIVLTYVNRDQLKRAKAEGY